MISAEWIFFTEAAAAASFALILPRTRFGIAIAAMTSMTMTTTKISTSENPLVFLRAKSLCLLTGGIAQK